MLFSTLAAGPIPIVTHPTAERATITRASATPLDLVRLALGRLGATSDHVWIQDEIPPSLFVLVYVFSKRARCVMVEQCAAEQNVGAFHFLEFFSPPLQGRSRFEDVQ